MPFYNGDTDTRIAREYEETTTRYDTDDVETGALTGYNGYDALTVRYTSPNGEVCETRGGEPRTPGVMEDDDLTGVVFGHGKKYVYGPDEGLRTLPYNGQGQTLGKPGQVHAIIGIDYPKPVPVDGAVQEGVVATIYYRSNRSGNVKTVDVDVEMIEGHAGKHQLAGREADGDRRFEALTAWDRTLATKYPNRTLGRVCRVEYPPGYEITITAENVTEDRIEDLVDRLDSTITKHNGTDSNQNEVTLSVTDYEPLDQ